MSQLPPQIEFIGIELLKPYPRNARVHSRKQVSQIASSIQRFGFTNPVLISDEREIIAGHGRVLAARELGMGAVPTIRLSHLSPEERRAYVLADNKLALNAGWDCELLAIEFQGLIDLGFDLTLTGFAAAEIDLTLDHTREAAPSGLGPADVIPDLPSTRADVVSRSGDLWSLGRHRLLCGDARSGEAVARVLAGARADLVFTDPPYNVRIDGNATGQGAFRHREFAMASGEMSSAAFTAFLTETLGHCAAHCRAGAIAFVCMDWPHMQEFSAAGPAVFCELTNVCVWNKSNAGKGAFYRSKHELVFVLKVGTAPHSNNFGLGETGRPRSHVWDYPGVSSLGSKRAEALAMHPTVKPVALVADAIRDCSQRGEIVLDSFGGSGTTLIAAETCGRQARLIEYDCAYCDTIIARWRRYSGKSATLVDGGRSFDEVADERLGCGAADALSLAPTLPNRRATREPT